MLQEGLPSTNIPHCDHLLFFLVMRSPWLSLVSIDSHIGLHVCEPSCMSLKTCRCSQYPAVSECSQGFHWADPELKCPYLPIISKINHCKSGHLLKQ